MLQPKEIINSKRLYIKQKDNGSLYFSLKNGIANTLPTQLYPNKEFIGIFYQYSNNLLFEGFSFSKSNRRGVII